MESRRRRPGIRPRSPHWATRPVTIYRLVTKGTIEEKIVELHRHKRDLADSLLEGTEMSGKISTDELLHLLSQF